VNCSEAQSQLSAYHDGELSPEAAAEVAGHLAACSACAAELEVFRKLSSMTRRLTDPPVPAGDWERLNSKLKSSRKSTSALVTVARRPLAVAVTILVLASVGAIAYRTWYVRHDGSHLERTFGRFLERFDDQPEAAQQILLTNYQGQPTTLQQAPDMLGYEPVIAKELPPGCKSHEAYLLDMPCCRCIEILCKQEDGHSVAIFEHDTRRPGWFGERNSIECLCHSVPTNVTQIGNELAATWKNGKRYLTVIGARDLDEVARFVAFYSALKAGDG
jgi:hypothetical protein